MFKTPTSLSEARALVRAVQKAAEVLHRRIPPPPDEPLASECCNRGCERCVYTAYYDALDDWRISITGRDSRSRPAK